ncbi:FMN-binding protein [Vibrio mediterranei]|uniref:FMN-binding protein n=1 Tax=Vibrio mediterranei TaxID=689 RepID=UPI00148CA5D5|nr:FMN-binding protein [Vibrio mediterranei]NOH28202.1 FMN-binding protein [Vibrio mediterranei]
MRFVTTLVITASATLLVACTEPDLKKQPPKPTELDQRLTLLESAGLMQKRLPVSTLIDKYVDVKTVDLNSGEFRPSKFDVDESLTHYPLSATNATSLSAKDDIAGIKKRENALPVYFIHDENGVTYRLVMPIRAQGKFGLIYGYLGLNSRDFSIVGLKFYKHQESKGLGAEITDNPDWSTRFANKLIFKDNKPSITLSQKHSLSQDPYRVDGISGATYTSKGVEHAINFWTGDLGFGKFLRKFRAQTH